MGMKGWTMSDKNNVDVLENNALVEKQIELEKRGKSLGALRFDTRMDKALDRGRGDETSFGSKVIAQNISELAAVIKTAMTARKAYRVPAVLKLMEEVDPQVVAMITLAGAIRASFNNESLTNTSVGIANNIYHEKLKCNLGDTGKKHFSSILKKSGAQGLEAVKVLEYVSTEHKVVIVTKLLQRTLDGLQMDFGYPEIHKPLGCTLALGHRQDLRYAIFLAC